MIQSFKRLLQRDASTRHEAPQSEQLIELDASVLDQIGGGDAPEPRNHAWTV
ncbi:MAG: hypothetical protein JNL19_08860 [Burkholderiales bacterium]|nr:hypothetical protein [Burkholderiales bacterium]